MANVRKRDAAWDCACGNGQVARDLAPHFTNVFATDISQKQLDNAYQAPNIRYSIAPAERTSFGDDSFSLITVAQSMHWLRIPEFFNEAKRVGKEGCILAYWGYALFRVEPKIDRIVDDFYLNVVGPYWDPERKLIDQHYETIDFPFERIKSPEFDFSFDWTLAELEGYITTWSAVQKFMNDCGSNPVVSLVDQLRAYWPTDRRHKVIFPLFVTVGRI